MIYRSVRPRRFAAQRHWPRHPVEHWRWSPCRCWGSLGTEKLVEMESEKEVERGWNVEHLSATRNQMVLGVKRRPFFGLRTVAFGPGPWRVEEKIGFSG